jgi:hypothetical protein
MAYFADSKRTRLLYFLGKSTEFSSLLASACMVLASKSYQPLPVHRVHSFDMFCLHLGYLSC